MSERPKIYRGNMTVAKARKRWRDVYTAAQKGDPNEMLDAVSKFQGIAETMFMAWHMADRDELLELLERCADSLEAEINDRYPEEIRNQYPSIMQRWKNDMEDVAEARTAIAKAKGEV